MRYEIVKNNKVMFWTEHEECLPPKEILKEMKDAGYELKKIKSKEKKDEK